MGKRFWISVVVLFVAGMGFGVVFHGLALGTEYAKLPGLFRPEADASNHFWAMLLAHLSMAFAFTAIYIRGREAKPVVGQGLRYGAIVALLTAVPTYLIYYAVQPMPFDLVVKQIVFDTIAWLVMGVIVAAINK